MSTISTNPAPPVRLPSPRLRAIVSVLVALHVLAVFVGPWAMPPGNSELSAKVAGTLKPYLEAFALGNGYRFFAPEPGPSHLIRYEVTKPDGSLVTGTFPSKQDNQPRLLYHRHFMLTEFVNTLGAPDPQAKLGMLYANAYARHLASVHDGRSVKLYIRRHYVPRTEEVRAGMRLDDPVKYEEQLLTSYERE